MRGLGFIRSFHPWRRRQVDEALPKAQYVIPIPPHPKGSQVMVSFFEKATMLPRPQVVFSIGTDGNLRCALPPAARVEVRMTWIEEDNLEGVRYLLGPASKFKTKPIRPMAGDLM